MGALSPDAWSAAQDALAKAEVRLHIAVLAHDALAAELEPGLVEAIEGFRRAVYELEVARATYLARAREEGT